MARTKQQALAQQSGLGGGRPRRRLATREDGYDHRHADERDRRVATVRTAEHMVFSDTNLMNIVGSHVKGDDDKLWFYK